MHPTISISTGLYCLRRPEESTGRVDESIPSFTGVALLYARTCTGSPTPVLWDDHEGHDWLPAPRPALHNQLLWVPVFPAAGSGNLLLLTPLASPKTSLAGCLAHDQCWRKLGTPLKHGESMRQVRVLRSQAVQSDHGPQRPRQPLESRSGMHTCSTCSCHVSSQHRSMDYRRHALTRSATPWCKQPLGYGCI